MRNALSARRVRRRRAMLLGVLAEHGPLPAFEIRKRVGWFGRAMLELGGLEADGLVVSGRAIGPDGVWCRYYRLAKEQP